MKKITKYNVLFVMILILLLGLTSCKKQQLCSKTYFEYFDTIVTINGYEKKLEDFNETLSLIEPLLDKYHKLFDIYYEYSGVNNICTVNKKAYLNPVKVDIELINMIEYGFNMYDKTNKMLNIAMGSVLKLWHNERENASDYPQNAKLPDMDKLHEASKYMNIKDIVINKEESTIFIKNQYTKFDVGAIAKGYACDQIAKVLIENNKTSYIINLGGNIKLIGSKPKNKDFIVGIQDPTTSSTSNLVTIGVSDYSVVTSGSYQRYYEVNGIRYHHIINPNTLMPENKYLSVTVVAKESTLCDCLSTALFNLSIEEGKNVIKSFEDIYVMWVDKDKKITYSDGFDKLLEE